MGVTGSITLYLANEDTICYTIGTILMAMSLIVTLYTVNMKTTLHNSHAVMED